LHKIQISEEKSGGLLKNLINGNSPKRSYDGRNSQMNCRRRFVIGYSK